MTAVFKLNLHCERCISRVIQRIRSFDGVDTVTAGDGHKLTVVGSMDPAKLREKVEKKTRKKVKLISSQPKKGDGDDNVKVDENGKKDKKSESKEKKGSDDESDQTKSKDKETAVMTAVFKLNLHCERCISRVIQRIRSFDGVDTVTAGDGHKLTVVGSMDPAKLREKVEKKTRKKVKLMSSQSKKGDGDDNGKVDENGKKDKKSESKEKKGSDDESDQTKSKDKETAVTTAVFKVNLHCDGCIDKVYKTVSKTKGYEDMKIDVQKDLVTVTGAIDMKALAEVLSEKLKTSVSIVPPKKDGEKKENGGDEKGMNGGDGGDKAEGNKMQTLLGGYPYPFMPGPVVIGEQLHYNPYPAYLYHALGIFSDENPNACTIM